MDDHIHREIVRDAVNDPEPGPFPPWMRAAGIFLAALVALTVILAFSGNGILLDWLGGRAVSGTVSDQMMLLSGDTVIIFRGDSYEQLRQHYLDHQTVEFKVCLQGFVVDNTYFVDGFYVPRIYGQTVHSVQSEGCNSETIISLHSHPFERCIPSPQDRISAEAFSERSLEGISGLMCGLDRFTIYG